MHIPDGYLDMKIAVLFFILSAIVIAISLKKIKNFNTPLIGTISAAIFAAQMLNWPIPGGTSAHFVGGAFAGIILGPYAGCLAMTAVLVIQSFVYGDGGLISLGANIWNMAVVNVFSGYLIYQVLRRYGEKLASFIAGWLGITLAGISAGIQLGVSVSFKYALPVAVLTMGFWHALLGIIEGLITSAVVSYISVHSPYIIKESVDKKVVIAIVSLVILSPIFAYSSEMVNYSEPLENTAKVLGVTEIQKYTGIFPDYSIPGLGYIGTISGIVGVLILLLIAKALSMRG